MDNAVVTASEKLEPTDLSPYVFYLVPYVIDKHMPYHRISMTT